MSYKNNNKNYSISWILINSLGKLRFSRSSYYYIVIIPILVKSLENINNPISLNFGGTDIQLNLELPFSWYLFYFGAVAIAIGSIIYLIFCPELIKEYNNYGEFLDAGESDDYLYEICEKYNITMLYFDLSESPYLVEKEKTKEPVEKDSMFSKPIYNPDYQEKEKVIDYKHNIKYQEQRKNTFNQIYKEIKHKKQYLVFVAFIFYLLGFAAFTWVIIQNIIFVGKYFIQ